MARIVLALITKNSWERVREVGLDYRKVLRASLQVPYDVIIHIDDSESDATKIVTWEFARWHGKEYIFSRSRLYGYHRSTRATARQTAIDIFFESFGSSFDWLFFLDDDVVLNPGWFEAVKHVVKEPGDVGEIWGINYDVDPARERFLKVLGVDLKDYLLRKFEERGGTHDTMFRRDAIAGVRIPPELHYYEDAWLHFYVRCRGYRTYINEVGARHYHVVGSVREEMKLNRYAIEAAIRYGICEYEVCERIREATKARLKGWFGLLRPVVGFVPMVVATTKAFGIKKGLVEAFKRQYLKLWFRYQVLKATRKKRKLPDVCDSVLSRTTSGVGGCGPAR